MSQDLGNTNGWLPPTINTPGACNNFPPANWFTDYAFADVGAIVHTTLPAGISFECAQNRVFSGNPTPTPPRVFLHESGHTPFGLADEYTPPPNGGYYENPPFPNLYDQQNVCEADKVDPADTCRTFNDIFGEDWWTSDPTPNDLMVDNGVPNHLDLRRIGWLFSECDVGRC